MFSQCSTVFQLQIVQTLQEKEKQKKKASLAGFDNLRSKGRGFSILFLALNLAAGGEAEIENEGKAGRFSQYVIPALNLTNAACRQMKKDQELGGRRAEAHQKILGTSHHSIMKKILGPVSAARQLRCGWPGSKLPLRLRRDFDLHSLAWCILTACDMSASVLPRNTSISWAALSEWLNTFAV